MLTCADLSDRLYDEDCRDAFERGTHLPSDIAWHLATCHHCRDAVDAARDDARRFAAGLLVTPPAEVRVAVALAFDGTSRVAPSLIDWRSVNASLVAGAVAIGLVAGIVDAPLPMLSQSAVFVLGATIAFTIQALADGWTIPRLAGSMSRSTQPSRDSIL